MTNKDPVLELFKRPLSVINVGIEKLAEHLPNLGVEVIHVDWKPPANGNLGILKKLKQVIIRKEMGQ